MQDIYQLPLSPLCICEDLRADLEEQQPECAAAGDGGTQGQAEAQAFAAAVDLTRACTPIPDSAAVEAGPPDHAEGDELALRLSEQGWEGAVIKSKPLL